MLQFRVGDEVRIVCAGAETPKSLIGATGTIKRIEEGYQDLPYLVTGIVLADGTIHTNNYGEEWCMEAELVLVYDEMWFDCSGFEEMI